MELPGYEFKISDFLDRITVIYGKTNSGKSTIVKDILFRMKDWFPLVFIVSPTEPSNHSYSSTVNPLLIRTDFSSTISDKKSLLDDLLELQEMKTKMYEKASNLDLLKRMYEMAPKTEMTERIKQASDKAEVMIEGSRDEGTRERIRGSLNAMLVQLYKAHIVRNKRQYKGMNLSEEEKYVLKYADLNPRVLLIMDDCAADLKQFWNKTVFRKIFYQGRHSNISALICCQDDTDLPAPLRKNVTISIFTRDTVFVGYFEKTANGYSKKTRQKVQEIATKAFTGHNKVIYIESDKTERFFYTYRAEPRSFVFGNPSLLKLCERAKADRSSIDKTNAFYDIFKL